MFIEPIFINFLAYETIELDHQKMKEVCMDRIKKYPSERIKGQSFVVRESHNINNLAEDIQPLFDIVQHKFDLLHKRFGLKEDRKQKITECWINHNLNEAIAEAHIHPKMFFTAVYYPAATKDSGRIAFYSPNPCHEYVIDYKKDVQFNNEFNTFIRWIYPQVGMLIIFPAWLRHQVFKNNDDSDRVSVAFNSMIVDV